MSRKPRYIALVGGLAATSPGLAQSTSKMLDRSGGDTVFRRQP